MERMYMLQVKFDFSLIFLTWVDSQFPLSPSPNQGAKKVILTACHSGKLKLQL